MVLEEKGVPYETIEESLSAPSEALLKLNPAGTVPVLIHNQKPLTESAIITEYLDEVFPEHPLLPKSPYEKAQVRLWTRWCDTQFKPDLDLYKYEWKTLTEAAQQALMERLHGYLEHLSATLKKTEFLLGEKLTLADIHVFPFYRQLNALKTASQPPEVPLKEFPVVDAWLERIIARPSFQRVIEKKHH
jgi:glutathione S-transferase